MAISQRSFFHGAVLAEITNDPHFTSINKVPKLDSTSAYQLNHDTGLYIKHATSENDSWRFTFTPVHQDEVRRLWDIYGDKTYIVFVCGETGFCIVDYGVFAASIDLNHSEVEWVEVYRQPGGSFRIRGAQGEHPRTIPINAFPKVLFEIA